MFRYHVGDQVRLRTTPDVEPMLWDHDAHVLAVLPEDRVVVELEEGGSLTCRGDQLEPMEDPFERMRERFWW